MKKILLLLLAAHVATLATLAKPRTQAELNALARQAINAITRHSGHAAPRVGDVKTLHTLGTITVMGYDEGGFAVVCNDDVVPEVLAVSDTRFSRNPNPSLQWWLRAINEVCESIIAHGPARAASVPTPTALGFEPSVAPIVSAEWDQEAPYSDLCPHDRNNRRCLTGCVATAISQVLYTHRTPIVGSGQRTNKASYSSYQNSNGSYENVSFVYEGWTPDYDNMIDQYTSGPKAGQYTTEQAAAVADLMLACGVAVNMSYGSDGSGAYTDQAAEGLIQYMGIETADFKERASFSDQQWMTMVYEELEGGHAMYYSAVDPDPWQGGGHAFVCDGYDAQGRVHINWGWSGEDNGFFNINLLNPGAYEFSQYQDFIRGLWDPNEHSTNTLISSTIDVQVAGTLSTLVADADKPNLGTVKLSGKLDASDIAFLRDLASGVSLQEKYNVEGEGHLKNIDLGYALLPDSTLPEDALRDAVLLRQLTLPRQLKAIGSNALNGCKRLTTIISRSFAVPAMGSSCFTGVPNNITAIFVAGSADAYKRNGQWKKLLEGAVISEYGTSFVARNYSRKYGSPNPVLGYQINGDRIVGSPRIACAATAASPVGKYAITIEPGTVEATDDIYFIGGTLTVSQVPLTVGVQDASRYVGEQNPQFTLTFDGFLMDDTAESLEEMPVATCEADAESPEGSYVITVSGGKSQNYKLSYTTGTLTVETAPTAVVAPHAQGSNGAQSLGDVYSVSGRLIRRGATSIDDLPAGIYIVGGQKLIKTAR